MTSNALQLKWFTELPSDFLVSCLFQHPLTLSATHSLMLTTLKELMNQLQYRQPRSPSNNPIFVHKDLADCTHVFIRNDAKKLPLQPTYNGPFKVVDRKTRHFVITYNDGRTDTVSIDRLKPAYSMASSDIPIDPSSSNQSPFPVSQSHPTTIITSPAIQTRSGQHVQFPNYLSHTISS